MSGMANWKAKIELDIKDLQKQLIDADEKIDKFANEDRKVKLDIDTKTLESAIQKLDKMLDSLGKGTGDFKQFENLSKELSSIVSEVQSLSKAFGKVDDSGAKTLLSSIQNIDKSLSELSQNILNVNKNMSNMGGNTSGAVKQVENISNAYQNAAKEAEKLADAQSKIGQKTNISSGDFKEQSTEIDLYHNLEKRKVTYDEIIDRIQTIVSLKEKEKSLSKTSDDTKLYQNLYDENDINWAGDTEGTINRISDRLKEIYIKYNGKISLINENDIQEAAYLLDILKGAGESPNLNKSQEKFYQNKKFSNDSLFDNIHVDSQKTGEIDKINTELSETYRWFNQLEGVSLNENIANEIKSLISDMQIGGKTANEYANDLLKIFNIEVGSNSAIEQQNKLQEELKETQQQAEETKSALNDLSNIKGLKHYTDEVFDKFDNNMFGSGIGENRLGKAAYFFDEKNSSDWEAIGEYSKYLTTWSAEQVKIFDQTLGFTEEQINQIIKEFYSDVDEDIQEDYNFDLKNIMDEDLYEFKSKFGIELQDVMKSLGYDAVKTNGGEYAFYNTDKLIREVQVYDQEAQKIIDINNKVEESIKETSSDQTKDAFQTDNSDASTVQKVADNFKEVKQNTDDATKATEKYKRVLSQVGELGVDAKISAMYQRNDGQLESVSWKAKRDDQGQILYDKDGNIDYDVNMTVISKYEQLEKIITTADNKLRDLKKSLQDTQNLNPNASTDNIEKQIQYQEDYIKLLEQTVKAISQQDEYLLYEQQIIDARAKAEKEYNLNQGTKSDISNAKQLASEESKRQKAIEQTNRLLNRQQITIDNIEKSYNKTINPDLDKSVSDVSDLSALATAKSEIQNLINQLSGQERNSSNEQEFLKLEKLISAYKQLAKDKLKANNPSKQELGGQDLKVLLEQQVSQYNQLISKAEKYGDATSDIVEKLKAQRDLIAQANSDGVYTAKSGLKADDYYSVRDNYKIGKAQFSSYETDIKNTEKLIQAQKELGEATTKARQAAKDSTQSSVDNALKEQVTAWKNIQSIREKIAKTKDTDEIANLQQVKKEYQQNYIEADRILKSNSSLYDKEIQLAKLEQIRVETNKKIADYQDKQISGYDNRLESYTKKTSGYNATIARFNDGGWISDEYLKNVQAVKDAVKKYEDLLSNIKAKGGIISEEDVQKLKEYEGEIKKTISTVTNMSASEKGYNFVSAQKELDKIHKLLNENSNMSSEAKAKIKAYYAEIESGNPSMSLDKIHGEILKIYNAEVEAGRAGRSFFDTLKNSGFHQIAAQMAGMFGVYDIINLGKEAISTIVSLDDALVDLKKTTAMNGSQLEDFYYDANDVAKQMGVTTQAIIEQSSAWSRLGYNTAETSTEMAKLSSQFASISPGMEVDEAQSGLVSIMKAWSIDPDQVKSEIMDPINQLGNTMAEDNQDIVEGMERSAAALAAVGTSTKDAFALFSGIQEVLQNAEKSGTSLRSVALRLRSFDETTGEYSEDLANITGELIDLTKTAEHAEGVSIFKPGSTTEFKDLTDYFREIAGIWDEMTQKQQNDFLIKAFGRNQAQAGAALIQNFEAVDKALAEMGESAGSSDKEMEAVESSLSFKINALKETWVGCVQDMIDRGDLGTIVTGLTKVSEAITFLLDKLGILGSIGLGAGIFSGIKNVGRDKMYSLSF